MRTMLWLVAGFLLYANVLVWHEIYIMINLPM